MIGDPAASKNFQLFHAPKNIFLDPPPPPPSDPPAGPRKLARGRSCTRSLRSWSPMRHLEAGDASDSSTILSAATDAPRARTFQRPDFFELLASTHPSTHPQAYPTRRLFPFFVVRQKSFRHFLYDNPNPNPNVRWAFRPLCRRERGLGCGYPGRPPPTTHAPC